MDLAKVKINESKSKSRIINILFSLPGLWLIYYFLLVRPDAQITDFQEYRNNLYSYFIPFLIVVGLLIFLRRGKEVISNNNSFNSIIPGIIQGIILVTFSYAIAGFIKDLFNLF